MECLIPKHKTQPKLREGINPNTVYFKVAVILRPQAEESARIRRQILHSTSFRFRMTIILSQQHWDNPFPCQFT